VFGFARDPLGSSAAQGVSAETPSGRTATPGEPDPGRQAETPAASGARLSSRLRVTAIGDSVLRSADTALRGVFPFLTIDADVGRQANEVFDEIAWLKLGGRLGQIVVIDTGSNGIVSSDELDDLLEKLADRRRVVLVTVHTPRLWQDPNNAIFRAAAERYPNTTIADWNSVAAEHPEWFYPDGTHVRPEYAYHYADVVKAAALDPIATQK
jgi:hypothetical protein